MRKRGNGRGRRVAVPHGFGQFRAWGALLRKTLAKGSDFGRWSEYSPLNTEKKGRSTDA